MRPNMSGNGIAVSTTKVGTDFRSSPRSGILPRLLTLILPLCGSLSGVTSAVAQFPASSTSGSDRPTSVEGVAFDVPAMGVCYRLPSATDQASSSPAAPSAQPSKLEKAHLVSYRKPSNSEPAPEANAKSAYLSDQWQLPATTAHSVSYLLPLDVTVVFADPEPIQTIMFEVFPLSRSWQIRDFAPRSMSVTDHEGPISEEVKEDRSAGGIGDLKGGIPGYADFSLHFDGGGKSNTMRRQQWKAPHTQIVASGLTQRGGGVFYKFNRSNEFLIEGGHRLELILDVPDTWQGDLVRVHCRAIAADGTMHVRDFLMAVTIDGDASSLELARQFAAADARTQSYLRRWQVHRRPDNLLAELGAAFQRDKKDPAPDRNQLARLLLTVTRTSQIPGFTRLPESMQRSIADTLIAKSQLLQLAR